MFWCGDPEDSDKEKKLEIKKSTKENILFQMAETVFG